MLKFPEIVTLSAQLQQSVCGRTVSRVLPPSKPHRFCWYQGDPSGYDALISGRAVCGAPIVREAHLGGSVYFCPICHPLS